MGSHVFVATAHQFFRGFLIKKCAWFLADLPRGSRCNSAPCTLRTVMLTQAWSHLLTHDVFSRNMRRGLWAGSRFESKYLKAKADLKENICLRLVRT